MPVKRSAMARKTRIILAMVRRSFQRRKVQMMRRLPTMEAVEEIMVRYTLGSGIQREQFELLLLLPASHKEGVSNIFKICSSLTLLACWAGVK